MSIAMASLTAQNKYQPIHPPGLPDEPSLLSQLSGVPPVALMATNGGIPVITTTEVAGQSQNDISQAVSLGKIFK